MERGRYLVISFFKWICMEICVVWYGFKLSELVKVLGIIEVRPPVNPRFGCPLSFVFICPSVDISNFPVSCLTQFPLIQLTELRN